MASIKVNSKLVIEACEKKKEVKKQLAQELTPGRKTYLYEQEWWITIEKIQKLAEYSPSGTIDITHEDFALIGAYLPKPNQKHVPEK